MAIVVIFPAIMLALVAASLLSIWRNRAPERLRPARTRYAVAGSLAALLAALAVLHFVLPLLPPDQGKLPPLPCHGGKYFRC